MAAHLAKETSSDRVVLHLDVDNFYVGVERVDEPSLVGRPVAVTQGNSGGIVALSDEAKAAGLRKGDGVGVHGRAEIPSLKAMGSMSLDACRAKCPGLIVRPMRVERYREAGQALLETVQDVCGAATPVEKTSYDDVYCDVTSVVLSGADSPPPTPRARAWTPDAGPQAEMIATLPLEMRSACALAERLRGAIKQRGA